MAERFSLDCLLLGFIPSSYTVKDVPRKLDLKTIRTHVHLDVGKCVPCLQNSEVPRLLVAPYIHTYMAQQLGNKVYIHTYLHVCVTAEIFY